ncbi:transmembrane regulator, partial [Salmonella enterica subsp. enterica serovar Typhimurium]
MNETIFLLDKRVVFDSTKMTLSHGNEIIRISEAETHLLLAFWHGLYKKEDIIHYKLINQMRNDFSSIGLQ